MWFLQNVVKETETAVPTGDLFFLGPFILLHFNMLSYNIFPFIKMKERFNSYRLCMLHVVEKRQHAPGGKRPTESETTTVPKLRLQVR